MCQGQEAKGIWTASEDALHINCLELLAAFLSLKCFAANLSNTNILCRIDNTTAISYINRMDGNRYRILHAIAKDIWQWCEAKNIFLFASYIKSSDNIEADRASRSSSPNTEWELAVFAYNKIILRHGNPEIDLLADRTNRKCQRFV